MKHFCKCGNEIPPRRGSSIQSKLCPSCTYSELAVKQREKNLKLKNKQGFFFTPAKNKGSKLSPKQREKRRADVYFSKYIRLLFSFWDNKKETRICKCYTCGAIKAITDIDCGHYHGRAHSVTRFDINNARPQCKKCNRFQSGKHTEFEYNLVQEIGKEEVEAMKERVREQHQKADMEFYHETAELYKTLFNQLVADIGHNPFLHHRNQLKAKKKLLEPPCGTTPEQEE